MKMDGLYFAVLIELGCSQIKWLFAISVVVLARHLCPVRKT
ncbi:hypothetical protein D1AOALGA4SA_8200 [Olavius algarvensis Delta 1 endosymbiont]|nr:hypothetical protein D1AOALGA4SA_8200 [Olavius algarvensis Delta 1 endosymbiont]